MGIGAAMTSLASWLGGTGTAATATAATATTAATTGITAAQALGAATTLAGGIMSAKAISGQKTPDTITKVPDKATPSSESIEKEVTIGDTRQLKKGRASGRRQLMADRAAPSAGSSGLNV